MIHSIGYFFSHLNLPRNNAWCKSQSFQAQGNAKHANRVFLLSAKSLYQFRGLLTFPTNTKQRKKI